MTNEESENTSADLNNMNNAETSTIVKGSMLICKVVFLNKSMKKLFHSFTEFVINKVLIDNAAVNITNEIMINFFLDKLKSLLSR